MVRSKRFTKNEVLTAINQWIAEHGTAPTVEELRRVLRLGSTRTAFRYLRWLEDEGDIERWPGARGLRPLRQPKGGVETRSIPLVGEVPAGPLMLAEENMQGYVRVPKDLLKPSTSRFFLLRVRGNSMNQARLGGERIEEGDLAIVRQQGTADSGEIVVALIDGEATIKRFTRAPGYFVLKPESTDPKHKPILMNQDFRVQGVVVRVLKKGAQVFQFSGEEGRKLNG